MAAISLKHLYEIALIKQKVRAGGWGSRLEGRTAGGLHASAVAGNWELVRVCLTNHAQWLHAMGTMSSLLI